MAKTRKYDDLSKEELIRLLESRDRQAATRFGLVWEADEIERDRALNSDFVALDLVPDQCCGSTPWRNLIIEGDNFDALRFLRMGFAGRVKCIYIDPPYNTGNRDFVYNDRFVDKEDQWRHSKWCEFMYQRLALARDLLTPDGAIFVSIDDNEVFALGLLMEKVFGERNFLANIIWQKVFAPKNTARHFSDDHEYVVVYAGNADEWKPNLLPRGDADKARYKNPDNDPRGPWTSGDLQARNFYSEGTYPITCPSGRVIPGPGPGMYWRVSQSKFKELNADSRIWWGKGGNGMPRIKRFLSEVMEGRIPQTLWRYEDVGHTQEAKKELLALVEFADSPSVFGTPKPTRLIERVIRIATDPNDIVLDFFAGSGTTAQAALRRNREDNGNRRFILVSNTEATEDEPDKNLCRDVCAKRVRRVIEGYGDAAPLPGDFAYLRCRRLAPERLTRIQHEQVWLALQMIHRETVAPFKPGPFCWSGDATTALMYVPRYRERDIPAIRRQARQSGAVALYSWEPSTFARHLKAKNIHLEPIPESLARRFGQKG